MKPLNFFNETIDIIKHMDKKIAVITVLYENYTILDDFFTSFEKQTSHDFHIFIVDLSKNKKQINVPSFASILSGVNKGYAYGINFGIKKALSQKYSKFCAINSDVFVSDNFIENTLKSLEQNPSSLIGGKIYYAPGYEYHKERYEQKDLGKILWYAGGVNDWNNCLTKHRGVDEVDSGKYDTFDKTNFITGCFMGFDISVINKIGFWNEYYFLYYEDADYCERAKRSGIALFYDPFIILWHKNAQSTKGSGSTLHQTYQRKNQLYFGIKYAPFKTKLHLIINYFLKRK